MHPAYSIIVFTTMSGLGYGLAGVLGLGLLDPEAVATKVAHILALGLIAGGLLSSTLHLGNPQRAWRALSQWRSSWLSREGVLAIATFVPLTVAAYISLVHGRYVPVVGLVGALGAAATVYSTSMIYASLRSVQAWNTKLTPACYLLLSGVGGCLLGALFGHLGGQGAALLLALALAFLGAAWTAKLSWRNRAMTVAPLSTPESATGLGGLGMVRLFERPHINDNYLTREMGYRVARKHAAKLFVIAWVLGGAVPAALVILALLMGAQGTVATLAAAIAVLSHLVGVLVERWLFFAEAKHAVMNYYQQ